MREITVKVRRFNAEQGSFMESYQVPVEENEIWSVMNVLEYIYANLDSSLAFFSHAACKQAACGKCLVKINGKTGLACKERADAAELLLEPCGKTVIKDLIAK